MRVALALAVYLIASPASAVQANFERALDACDKAALETKYVDASLPGRKLGYSSERVRLQRSGPWEGHELIVIFAATSTGDVVCHTTLEYEVVLFQFDGEDVIRREPADTLPK